MTTTDVAVPQRTALPTTAHPSSWTPQQAALMEFVGLVTVANPGTPAERKTYAPPSVAEAFLSVCKRTGLDPFAKQIYAMEAAGKWSIIVGIDGFRIVAQRSKGYAGQIGPQWATGRKIRKPYVLDGAPVFHPQTGELVMVEEDEWVDAWTPVELGLPDREYDSEADRKAALGKGDKGHARPKAARIGIMRQGFDQPLWQVVTWDEFGVEPRYKGDNWGIRPAHMLGIRAETHGLRRTFPNDLSGLYTPEDFDEIDETENAAQVKAQLERVAKITDRDELTRVYHEWNTVGMADTVRAAIMARGGVLAQTAERAEAEGVDGTETEPAPGEAERGQGQAPEAPVGGTPTPEAEPVTEAHSAPESDEDWEARAIREHEQAEGLFPPDRP